jgi:hypothetical protein
MIVAGECSATAMLGSELTMNAMPDCFEAASADTMLTCAVLKKKVTSEQVFRCRL